MTRITSLRNEDAPFNRDDWQTPAYILQLITLFFGTDWFDPCPVGGRENMTPAFQQLMMNLSERVYINPPFSEYLEWVIKLTQVVDRPKNQEQIWMMHHDSSTQRQKLLMEKASAVCLLHERVKFVNPETLLPEGTSPGKSQTLIYIGKRPQKFKEVFSEIGDVLLK